MYSKPNVSMVAAVARNMSHTANVTIYGMVCDVSDYCEIEFETIDDLVIHLVNDHNEMWTAEGLKDIKIDGNLLGRGILIHSSPYPPPAIPTKYDYKYKWIGNINV